LLAFLDLTATAPHTADERQRALQSKPPAITVDGVNKCFRLPHQQFVTLKQRALHPFQGRTYDELHALRDVTFEIADGEFFGIVGRNGSGKSTLLKCLASIYDIDSGRVSVAGRVSPFIELGVGFNPELTARDNVILNAIMLGLSRREARSRFDEIIAFAELDEFVDLKLKNYSSGMAVRLGFAVAVQVDADVLLVDEVLAVGDAAFQQKCFNEFDRMKAEGRTIVFVTHDMSSVERFCDRAMLIEKGRIRNLGQPEEISRQYSELNFGASAHSLGGAAAPAEAMPVRILGAWCEDEQGERIITQQQGERCRACMEVEFTETVNDPHFAVTFRNAARHTILVTRSEIHGPGGRYEAGDRRIVCFSFVNLLASSRYELTPSVSVPDLAAAAEVEDMASLIVAAPHWSGGVADLPHELEVRRP